MTRYKFIEVKNIKNINNLIYLIDNSQDTLFYLEEFTKATLREAELKKEFLNYNRIGELRFKNVKIICSFYTDSSELLEYILNDTYNNIRYLKYFRFYFKLYSNIRDSKFNLPIF